MKSSIGIIGGGITGLTLAYYLEKAGLQPVVYEKGTEAGGVMRSRREDGWLAEHGPNTVMARTTKIHDLVREVGLGDDMIYANPEASKRFIVRGGHPRALPTGLGSFLGTGLFSWKAKLRLLKEPFIPPWDNQSEESLAHFVERRLGREFLDYAINPFVAGVYAGSPQQLSVKHAFAKLYELEQKYGSLIKGQFKGAKERKQREDVPKTEARLFSFREGLQQLPKALASKLGQRIHFGATVERVERAGNQWLIEGHRGAETFRDSFDAVVYTGPSHRIDTLDLQLEHARELKALKQIYYPPVSVLTLGFDREKVRHPLDGFGALVPEVEPFRILGTLFSSTLFPGRAPKGHVSLTSFVGGARRPELARKPEEEVRELVLQDLQKLLGVSGTPAWSFYSHWPRAIPQYEIGYGVFKDIMDRVEAQNRGFFFAGNYRGGISVSDCLMFARELADRISGQLPASL